MENILLLTDFSESAFHAACFAGCISQQLHSKKLILYHAYELSNSVAGSLDFVPNLDDLMQKENVEALNKLKERLGGFVHPQTEIHCITGAISVAASINEISDELQADLIVMGITGKSSIEEKLVGSLTTKVAGSCLTPLLIVPNRAKISPVAKVVFACDLKAVPTNIPIVPLRKVLEELAPELMVINLKDPYTTYSEEDNQEKLDLVSKMFPVENPASFHYLESPDIIEGIMDFSLTNQASLIILVPRDYGFFEGLFHRSVTKQLAFHTSIPLLVINEKAKIRGIEMY